jgi:hypothetical protein
MVRLESSDWLDIKTLSAIYFVDKNISQKNTDIIASKTM